MVLDHALLVLFCKSLTTKLDDMQLIDGRRWLWYELWATLLHRVIDVLFKTVLKNHVVELLLETLLDISKACVELFF